jgi:predicted Fe-S protein YdhL (DUF1289 family)
MIQSPCIGVCEYGKNTEEVFERVCRGCGRTAKEIEEWYYAINERKREIIEESRKRKEVIDD